MVLLASLYLFKPAFVSAVLIPNLVLCTEIAPPWVANPSGHGTWDLLYSCTFTIFLYIYTTINLNIPPEGSNFRF
ncbi:hypothetical protein NA56DRAFT_125637 [Hyaloscypha hepaticicola]|uniref:Uncharacterized protein n=1 Tax=Hyaloscypha hepaticicola TaxID=2082293 RepID=A0A2J6Q510_9HELO|nr:hypothetical protein NA56DRAFT_125637 [Hyaloscypha hepaticicola]